MPTEVDRDEVGFLVVDRRQDALSRCHVICSIHWFLLSMEIPPNASGNQMNAEKPCI